MERHAAENGRLQSTIGHAYRFYVVRSYGCAIAATPTGSGRPARLSRTTPTQSRRRSPSAIFARRKHPLWNGRNAQPHGRTEKAGWLEIDVIHCQAMVLQGELTAADERAKELVEMADKNGSTAVCQCLIIRGRIAIENGDYVGAIETLENALVAYEVIDSPTCTHRVNNNWDVRGLPLAILTTQPAPSMKLSPPF